jgi:hypothetical protein
MSVPGGAQVVGLELDGGKAHGPMRQVGNAPIARCGIRQRDDTARMQKPVWRHQTRLHFHRDLYSSAFDLKNLNSQVCWEMAQAEVVEKLGILDF